MIGRRVLSERFPGLVEQYSRHFEVVRRLQDLLAAVAAVAVIILGADVRAEVACVVLR